MNCFSFIKTSWEIASTIFQVHNDDSSGNQQSLQGVMNLTPFSMDSFNSGTAAVSKFCSYSFKVP